MIAINERLGRRWSRAASSSSWSAESTRPPAGRRSAGVTIRGQLPGNERTFVLRIVGIVALLLVLVGCTADGADEADAKVVMTAPVLGACRLLVPDDIDAGQQRVRRRSAAPAKHTAQTFAVGTFPADLAGGDDPDDPALGAYVYDQCQPRFQRFLGGDESLVLRSTMTWAWFRPSKAAWDAGRALVALRRGRRRRAVQAVRRRCPRTAEGPAARQARRPLAGLRRRPDRQRVGRRSPAQSRTPGGR